jgi:uncharacterized membrane protein
MRDRSIIPACTVRARNDKMQSHSLIRVRYGSAICCLLAAFVLAAACSRQPRYPAPPIEGDNIVIQTASLPPEAPQFFTYRARGKEINFFVIRLQGRVLSFLDACLSCYPRKLGYQAKDGVVVCRACDTHYSIYKLETGIGGCFPIKIEGKQVSGGYVIARAALERHAGKF